MNFEKCGLCNCQIDLTPYDLDAFVSIVTIVTSNGTGLLLRLCPECLEKLIEYLKMKEHFEYLSNH